MKAPKADTVIVEHDPQGRPLRLLTSEKHVGFVLHVANRYGLVVKCAQMSYPLDELILLGRLPGYTIRLQQLEAHLAHLAAHQDDCLRLITPEPTVIVEVARNKTPLRVTTYEGPHVHQHDIYRASRQYGVEMRIVTRSFQPGFQNSLGAFLNPIAIKLDANQYAAFLWAAPTKRRPYHYHA